MSKTQYIKRLNVGISQTFGGGIAIGGDGKFASGIAEVSLKHGLKINPNTREWHHPDGSKYDLILADLLAL